MSVLMRAQYQLFLSVKCISGSQICEMLKYRRYIRKKNVGHQFEFPRQWPRRLCGISLNNDRGSSLIFAITLVDFPFLTTELGANHSYSRRGTLIWTFFFSGWFNCFWQGCSDWRVQWAGERPVYLESLWTARRLPAMVSPGALHARFLRALRGCHCGWILE